VVNAARGGIIAETDLLAALESKHLAGVGLDTWEKEPNPYPKLVNHPQVWCSPHIGASTEEAQLAIAETVVDQVIKAVDGAVVDYPVNLPQLGVIRSPIQTSYAVLAEKLGSLIGQILEFNPSRFAIAYRGNLAHEDHALVRLALMKGYLSHVVDGYVSFVNVESHADRLGIKVSERDDPSFQSYQSALKCEVHGPDGKVLTVGGIVFDDRYARISLINDFYFEVEPTGYWLVLENHDRPGVIGDVGHYLGAKNINIDSFALSRNRQGGMAMAIIRTDSKISSEDLQGLLKIPNVTSAKDVRL
jgi:D-3-phosphoglycerate dehydrogenase